MADQDRGIDRVVAYSGGKLWYRIYVGVETVQRARVLATGGVGPEWRLEQSETFGTFVVTTDPDWFLDLDVKIKQSLGKHSVR